MHASRAATAQSPVRRSAISWISGSRTSTSAHLTKAASPLRGGRQELVFGDQRLVGHGNWLNTARSFDGVRGVFRHKKLRVDGFAASVVAIQMDDVNRSGGGNYLYGADAPLAVLPYGGVIEPYVFVRTAEKLPTETGSVGDLTSATSGDPRRR